MNVAILIMAAGFSQRFRKTHGTHKLLAMLHGKPIIQHTIEHAKASGMDVFVICRPEDVEIHQLIMPDNLIIYASQGMGNSIAAAVNATAHYDGWIIALGDMPLLTTTTYQAVRDALQTSSIVRTKFNDIPGHPVGFNKEHFQALSDLTGDEGARSLLRTQVVKFINSDDSGCVIDIDTELELQQINFPSNKS